MVRVNLEEVHCGTQYRSVWMLFIPSFKQFTSDKSSYKNIEMKANILGGVLT